MKKHAKNVTNEPRNEQLMSLQTIYNSYEKWSANRISSGDNFDIFTCGYYSFHGLSKGCGSPPEMGDLGFFREKRLDRDYPSGYFRIKQIFNIFDGHKYLSTILKILIYQVKQLSGAKSRGLSRDDGLQKTNNQLNFSPLIKFK